MPGWVPIYTFGTGTGGGGPGTQGPPGPQGPPGASVTTGSAPPSPSQGNPGDIYIELDNGQTWLKSSPFFGVPARWKKVGNISIGPPGKNGAVGPPGPMGLQGAPGPTGPAGSGGGGGGDFTLISTQTLGSNTATVTFTSIPGTYTHLKLLLTGRNAGSNSSDTLQLQFNGDSTGNYDYQTVQFAGGGNALSQHTGQTSANIGDVSGANATAGYTGTYQITIPGYAQTTFFKAVLTDGWMYNGTTFRELAAANWRSTAAITSISLFFGGGSNWLTGSVFSLYGMT